MDNPKPFLSMLASSALFCTLAVSGSLLSAQQAPDQQAPPSQAPSQAAPQPGQDSPGAQPGQASPGSQAGQPAPEAKSQTQEAAGQTFAGTVVKSGDKYVLQSTDGTAYDIDHQDLVKKFEGKQVRVKGTLDSDGKTIHITQ